MLLLRHLSFAITVTTSRLAITLSLDATARSMMYARSRLATTVLLDQMSAFSRQGFPLTPRNARAVKDLRWANLSPSSRTAGLAEVPLFFQGGPSARAALLVPDQLSPR